MPIRRVRVCGVTEPIAYAICMALGALWLDLDSSGALWRGLDYFGRNRLMMSWRWGLPALIKRQYRGDSIRPNDPRNGLLRRPRRRRRCGIFAARPNTAPTASAHHRAAQAMASPRGNLGCSNGSILAALAAPQPWRDRWQQKSRLGSSGAANFLSGQAACRFSSSASNRRVDDAPDLTR
jgi:hypothetical protein